MLRQAGDSFAWSCDLSDAEAVVAFDDDDFAMGDEAAIDEKLDGFLDAAVEFDDRAGAKFDDVFEQHSPGSKAQGHAEFDIEKKIEIAIGWRGVRADCDGGWVTRVGCRSRLAVRRLSCGGRGLGGLRFGGEVENVEFEVESACCRR